MRAQTTCFWLPFLSILFLGPGDTSGAEETADELRSQARAVLAQLDGQIHVAGLMRPVAVLRDWWGVPHIYAENQDDLFFAQGFVAAQDRLYQIDMWKRVAMGQTAEVLGPDAVVRDRFARLVKYRGEPGREWASYGADTRRIAAAFTRGINAYIDHVGDRLPIEFQILDYRPKKWSPEDCLGRMSVLPVAFNLRREVARAELVAAVGAEQARQIMPTDPRVDFAPADGVDLSGIDESLLAGYKAAVAAVAFDASEGSNNWVTGGRLSASGKPLLASDPHRAIGLPSLRYLVHLNAPGWNVIGAGEPALPGVAIGHNERIAWGFTVVLTDQADLYVEETNPADPNQYKVGDRWQPMEIVRETISVRGAEPVQLELQYTRHGPVIHEDRARHRAYALRWMGSEPGTAAYLCSLAVDRADNWKEFREAIRGWKAPSENIVYADTDGNIGWVAAALTPVRNGWHGLLPVPGANGKYRWQRFLHLEELPQAYNPPEHFIATANHNILPPGYPHEISYDWVSDYRYRRVRGRLESSDRLTLEDFKSIQYDNVSIPGQQLAGLLAVVGVADRSVQPFVKLLGDWDGTMAKDSQAAPLYVFWLQELRKGFYGPKTPEHLIEAASARNGIVQMLAELTKPTSAWFGPDPVAKRDRLVRETFDRAVGRAKQALGEDPGAWAWGKLHHVWFRHPCSQLGPAYSEAFDVGPVPSGSGRYTPDQAWFDEDFARYFGPTYRQVFDLSDWDTGQATSAPGQSGQPGSPHYADLVPLWEHGQYFPLAFSREKVHELTRHRLVLKPAH